MAQQEFWQGSEGPFLIEDTDTYPDGAPFRAGRTSGTYTAEGPPAGPNDVARAVDVADNISGTIFDAKGDMIVASGDNAWGRLPAGAAGEQLISDPSELLGIRWGTSSPSAAYGEGTLAGAVPVSSIVPGIVNIIFDTDTSKVWLGTSLGWIQIA